MKKFKVNYTGFAYVKADSTEEAEEKFDDDDYLYGELKVESIEEINEFSVRI